MCEFPSFYAVNVFLDFVNITYAADFAFDNYGTLNSKMIMNLYIILVLARLQTRQLSINFLELWKKFDSFRLFFDAKSYT